MWASAWNLKSDEHNFLLFYYIMNIKSKNSLNKENIANEKNKKLIDEFKRLIKQIEYEIDHARTKSDEIKHMFRLKSIRKALMIIIKFPDEITSGDQLENTPGIGKGTRERIDEIMRKGQLSEITTVPIQKEYIKYVEELEQIYGIGRKKAYELVVQYDIKSIAELKSEYKKGNIELTDNIIMGLKYYTLYKKQIPRSEMLEIDVYLHKVLITIDPQLIGVMCGSYRREKPTSNDIDMMICHPKIKTMQDVVDKISYLNLFVKELSSKKFITDSLTSEDVTSKYMGFCKFKKNAYRRIDIRYMPYDSYYAALMYFTGSAEHNQKIRAIAKNLGYLLNEYGLYKIKNGLKKHIIVNSEKDIYTTLGLEYISPEKR